MDAENKLVSLLEGCAVLITRGEDGMELFRHGSAPFHVPAAARYVFDVTGAGDTLVASLALLLAARTPLHDAIAFAASAAAVAASQQGTSPATVADLCGELSLEKQPIKVARV